MASPIGVGGPASVCGSNLRIKRRLLYITMEPILTAANDIYKKLGPGFSERVYHNAMEVTLRKMNIQFETERTLKVMLDDTEVGSVRSDLIINNSIVVELKAVRQITDTHIAQCKMYMRLLGLSSGIVINFPIIDEALGVETYDTSYVRKLSCSRCGRTTHTSARCFAQSGSDGNPIG